MTLDKFLYGDSDKEKEAYQKGFMDGMRAAKVEAGYYKDDDMDQTLNPKVNNDRVSSNFN